MDQKATKSGIFFQLGLWGAPTTAHAVMVTSHSFLSTTHLMLLLGCLTVAGIMGAFFWRHHNRVRNQASEHLNILWRYLPDLVTEISHDGTVRKVNRAMTGHSVGDMIGRDGAELLSEGAKSEFTEAVKMALSERQAQKYQAEIVNPEGRKYWVENRIIPINDRSNDPSLLVITSDLSLIHI